MDLNALIPPNPTVADSARSAQYGKVFSAAVFQDVVCMLLVSIAKCALDCLLQLFEVGIMSLIPVCLLFLRDL